MEEMLEDVLDMDEDEELEEEADAEVEKVLFEITDGKLGEAGSVKTDLPVGVEPFFLDLDVPLTIWIGNAGTDRRARGGQEPRTVPEAVERVVKWLKVHRTTYYIYLCILYSTGAYCIRTINCSFMLISDWFVCF